MTATSAEKIVRYYIVVDEQIITVYIIYDYKIEELKILKNFCFVFTGEQKLFIRTNIRFIFQVSFCFSIGLRYAFDATNEVFWSLFL